MSSSQDARQLTFLGFESKNPSLRQISAAVRAGGLTALPSAVLRADKVQYQEITCRSALNKVAGMPFAWTLNPYRGCTHGCHYCFARRYQSHLELDSGDAFSSIILIKVNFADVLRRELKRATWRPALVTFGTATDPYQPIEGRYELSRRTLEVLLDHPTPLGLITKGPLVIRDTDLLAELGRLTQCTVYVSVPTTDTDAWEKLEPGTSPPSQRLRAVSQLAARGINVGVLMAPLVPGITSQRAKLDRTLRAVADSGARFVGTNILHLDGGTRDHFMKFLAQNYPDLLDGYERLYRGKYASPGYANKIQALVNAIQVAYMPKYNRSAKAGNWQQITTAGRGLTQRQTELNWG